MSTKGSCFKLDSVVACVNITCFTVALCLVGVDALSRSACLSGNGGIFWVVAKATSSLQHLLQFVLGDHFRIESRSVVLLTVSCDSRDSIGHSSGLCEHRPGAHAVENAG
jgi:hypothetical protein